MQSTLRANAARDRIARWLAAPGAPAGLVLTRPASVAWATGGVAPPVDRSADTDLAWSYASPAALLAPGERTGRYRVGGDQLLTDAAGDSSLSMEDFAIALVDEAEQPRHVRARFSVAN